jgi:hypothetical protein
MWGGDFTESGPVVLGVYPRLTASYVGLHASICNPVGLVLDLLNGISAPLRRLTAKQSSVSTRRRSAFEIPRDISCQLR